MKSTVIYDGTFPGFLSAVFEVYARRLDGAVIAGKAKSCNLLFENIIYIQTDEAKASRVWNGFRKKLSARSASDFFAAFLSEQNNIENALLSYMKYVFSNAKKVDFNFANPHVLLIARTAKRVYREKHRMEAFTRFQMTADGMYYAVIHPDFNVLPLINLHFTRRYSDQRWMIFDEKRRYGLYYDPEKAETVEVIVSEESSPHNSAGNEIDVTESMYERLWRTYFNSVNIPSRKNTKLHMRHMPLRYWRYLTEKKPQLQNERNGIGERVNKQ